MLVNSAGGNRGENGILQCHGVAAHRRHNLAGDSGRIQVVYLEAEFTKCLGTGKLELYITAEVLELEHIAFPYGIHGIGSVWNQFIAFRRQMVIIRAVPCEFVFIVT